MVNTNIHHLWLRYKVIEHFNYLNGVNMIVYDRLWETMRKKGITQYKLITHYGISPAQITRLKRNANVNTHTIDILCEILNCNVEDIMQHVSN